MHGPSKMEEKKSHPSVRMRASMETTTRMGYFPPDVPIVL
jgi:hypothetical protein